MLTDYLVIVTMSMYLHSTPFFELFYIFSVLPFVLFSLLQCVFPYRFISFLKHSEFFKFISYFFGLFRSNKFIFFIYFFVNFLFCESTLLHNGLSYITKRFFLTQYLDLISKSLLIANFAKQVNNLSSFKCL